MGWRRRCVRSDRFAPTLNLEIRKEVISGFKYANSWVPVKDVFAASDHVDWPSEGKRDSGLNVLSTRDHDPGTLRNKDEPIIGCSNILDIDERYCRALSIGVSVEPVSKLAVVRDPPGSALMTRGNQAVP